MKKAFITLNLLTPLIVLANTWASPAPSPELVKARQCVQKEYSTQFSIKTDIQNNKYQLSESLKTEILNIIATKQQSSSTQELCVKMRAATAAINNRLLSMLTAPKKDVRKAKAPKVTMNITCTGLREETALPVTLVFPITSKPTVNSDSLFSYGLKEKLTKCKYNSTISPMGTKITCDYGNDKEAFEMYTNIHDNNRISIKGKDLNFISFLECAEPEVL